MLTIVPRFDCQDLRLIEAARSGDSSQIRRLLDEGADPDEADANGLTALIMASSVGELEAVKILLGAGADTTKKDNLGYDAYHAAMFHGDFRGATVAPYDQIMKLLKSKMRP
ncbi:MAG: ankyrin repeat domain-containing protein [Gammaproteobacteria bacterium]|nr:ankyrin repeat domain-containing protein [Gammaproteobacteria bacterium]